jgi:4-alpha-glucanotransferase
MISLDRLAERGYLDWSQVQLRAESDGAVDFEKVRARKLPLLREAARNFLQSAADGPRERFKTFCADNHWWLDDYALFAVLREHYGDVPWNSWPVEIAQRKPEPMAKLRAELADLIAVESVLQFAFFEQWRSLREHCAERNVRIIGDVAIFVSYDSADVWTHPEIFRLREDLSPEVVAGCPPDAFSETGQRWGNPLYDWEALKLSGYDWWIRRI